MSAILKRSRPKKGRENVLTPTTLRKEGQRKKRHEEEDREEEDKEEMERLKMRGGGRKKHRGVEEDDDEDDEDIQGVIKDEVDGGDGVGDDDDDDDDDSLDGGRNEEEEEEEEESDEEAVEQKDEATRDKGKVIVLLDLASLEVVKTKRGDYQLLTCDDHISIMRKYKKDPKKYRPDILHQELMALLDSPLNKEERMTIYIHTEKNVLIEVNPKCRIPRTFKRFSGLMVQLLHKLKIRSADGREMLLKVIKNPMSRHLPPGIRCFGLSCQGTLYNPHHFAASLPTTEPIMFVFGAMANGSILMKDHPYMTEMISCSEYPLSGVVAINRLLGAIENAWGIV